MKITAYFADKGTPKTGLTPSLDVYKTDGTKAIDGESMIEIAGGFYYYDFSDYDETEDYFIQADGGATLRDSDRYVISTNETAPIGNLLKVQKNKWKLENNQMIIYDDDGTTELYKFDLKNNRGSPSMKDVYERTPS